MGRKFTLELVGGRVEVIGYSNRREPVDNRVQSRFSVVRDGEKPLLMITSEQWDEILIGRFDELTVRKVGGPASGAKFDLCIGNGRYKYYYPLFPCPSCGGAMSYECMTLCYKWQLGEGRENESYGGELPNHWRCNRCCFRETANRHDDCPWGRDCKQDRLFQ